MHPEGARRTLAVRVDKVISISNDDRCCPRPHCRSMDGSVRCPPVTPKNAPMIDACSRSSGIGVPCVLVQRVADAQYQGLVKIQIHHPGFPRLYPHWIGSHPYSSLCICSTDCVKGYIVPKLKVSHTITTQHLQYIACSMYGGR